VVVFGTGKRGKERNTEAKKKDVASTDLEGRER
jgi:hypothetical protein